MNETEKKYRLVTRSDFDGLVCAMLLKELDMIDNILFVHPKDMQDGLIEIGPGDITTNLPYVEGVHLAFDHHLSETVRLRGPRDNHIIHPYAPSAARVLYNHYGGAENFPDFPRDMMAAVDKSDAAQMSREEILHPEGWVLMSYIMDPRTGLGRFHDFRISNYDLMMELIDYCRDNPVEKVLELPDVRERVELYRELHEKFLEQLGRCSEIRENCVILDLQDEETIYPGNRFEIYALYPEVNISVHVIWGKERQNTVLAVGHSIVNRSSNTNVGRLMLEYGGGGHLKAGTCQVPNEEADEILEEIVSRLNEDG